MTSTDFGIVATGRAWFREGMEQAIDRPSVVTIDAGVPVPGEQSAGMQRGQAFAHEGVWAGLANFPGGATTGWHHHGDYATYAYITEGSLTVEFGAGGEAVDVAAGAFVYIPARLVHRETVSDQGGAGIVVRVGGSGTTVHNVEGPSPTD